ncbi:hypothetical protein HOE37_01325 [Candidatus Woesearchaeota archaeon]|jgi:hypothetical protein|nr:hypothetical protein [Candidatus Woesearchaeota archaeon]MBT4110477.1 hypothetical protein [Candidatus Woesearchaeota archaeon]MBT4335999.1 hypothetical protein [Candidatus Woesearchaeota archaeon]MBT4469022.1 hypothetical protein [Candidatus Woesearchaeota archaeon]MBT6744659.1 hypothetical protein [Candidatus Woesearchaeota archaeon]
MLISKRKSGQMEMIGLVIIVILLSLGMLFMAQFALSEDGKKKIFTRKGLAYSTVSALMKTTVMDVDCTNNYGKWTKPQIGKDILEDCAKNFDYSPGGYSLYTCQGMHSCEFLEKEITLLLNETLGEWNKGYVFRSKLIKATGDKPELIMGPIQSGGGCPKSKERDGSGLFPIHTEAGLVETELFLCD